MTSPTASAVQAPLRQTSLVDEHRSLGARLIEFGGWEMPVQYTGIIEEHRAVRERAGLFDLSHMGELWVTGSGAGDGLAHALVTDPRALRVGRAHYSMMCTPEGGIIDDLIVYRVEDGAFLVVPNASNARTVADELRSRVASFAAHLDDASLRTALVALQGPSAVGVLQPFTDADLDALRYYSIAEGHVAGVPVRIARTGYTGEDGFELFLDWDAAPSLWRRLLEAGRSAGVIPAGLGARDTLRLEAGMALYGNELDRDTTPYDAGLGRIVKLDKAGGFVGRDALAAVAASGADKELRGLLVRGRGIARHGHEVYAPAAHAAAEESSADDPVGTVTSGAPSPTLGMPIAMAYLRPGLGEPGTMLQVAIRAARVDAEVVALPFYTRAKPAAAAPQTS